MILSTDPKLDVHGETRASVNFIVKDFIRDNVKLKKERILIVHGKGYGILREEVHSILKNHPDVESYRTNGLNIGATEVELKKKKC